jgi:fatty acid desaturase
VSSGKALANRSLKQRKLDGALLFGHCAAYLAVLFWIRPPGMAIAFIAVHQGLFGLYLGSLFAPNHKGMPILTHDDRPDFLRRQVLTSRNVTGGWFTDIALGGLNHQIEHHLFPSMPSPDLRKARVLVRHHCQELGVSYLETGLVASYRHALSPASTRQEHPSDSTASTPRDSRPPRPTRRRTARSPSLRRVVGPEGHAQCDAPAPPAPVSHAPLTDGGASAPAGELRCSVAASCDGGPP